MPGCRMGAPSRRNLGVGERWVLLWRRPTLPLRGAQGRLCRTRSGGGLLPERLKANGASLNQWLVLPVTFLVGKRCYVVVSTNNSTHHTAQEDKEGSWAGQA